MAVLNLMLDLETWGTEPGCDIRSIGATVFDPVTGDVSIPCQTCKGGTTRGNVNDNGDCSDCMNTRMERGYGDSFYIATDNPTSGGFNEHGQRDDYWFDDLSGIHRKYPLHRDPRTVQWWSEQSADAQAAFADPVDLRDALGRFGAWLSSVIDGMQSEPQSSTALRLWSHGPAFDPPILAAAYRAVGLPVPWHYRAPRDTRTAFDMVGIDDHSAWLSQTPGPLGIPHHALDDAICQARAVCGAYERIKWPHQHLRRPENAKLWNQEYERIDATVDLEKQLRIAENELSKARSSMDSSSFNGRNRTEKALSEVRRLRDLMVGGS